eukprot:CAMPEP_0171795340 /NCGR_PEP_ID=MMETSP0991-20121206/68658_1 /TAXON_ID=483369 /ORGANISM="non described non described, Strain CCMP2098" /LENGTH=102 /DNA_ID=CAMNT_0012405905 /DNA_START=528 /DNA_END=832 /DNA_ORIENTATION=-
MVSSWLAATAFVVRTSKAPFNFNFKEEWPGPPAVGVGADEADAAAEDATEQEEEGIDDNAGGGDTGGGGGKEPLLKLPLVSTPLLLGLLALTVLLSLLLGLP